MDSRKLNKKFYQKPTTWVAQNLLGHILVCHQGSHTYSGRIVETEAYLGYPDPACHSAKGKTQRNQSMFLDGGHAYVYLIYGIYYCFNVVTRTSTEPEAVLIRALEPLEGIEQMKLNRKQKNFKQLTNGPGKLCQAFEINKSIDGLSLFGEKIYIIKQRKMRNESISSSPRIGIENSGLATQWPLRFFITNSPYVSKKNN